MAKHISTEVSKTVLNFTRGSHPEGFTVTVYNDSYKTPSINRFASFQLNILAAGQDQLRSNDWYRLVPAVSYKIPPGDSTQFQVEILDVPPISEDFTGTLNLTARVYSPELRDEDRKDILLKVAGDSLSPPKLSLPDPHLTAYPGEQVELEVTLFNPNRKAIDCGLVLQGLDPAWLSDGVQKTLMLPPRESRKLQFTCQIPAPAAAPSQLYPITFELLHPVAVTAAAQVDLTVLPLGSVEFDCDPIEQWLPEKPGRWLNPRHHEATVALSFDNQSNLTLDGHVTVRPPAARPNLLSRLLRRKTAEPTPAVLPDSEGLATSTAKVPAQSVSSYTLAPEPVTLQPGQTAPLRLQIPQRSPWLGWARLRQFQLEASLAEPCSDALSGSFSESFSGPSSRPFSEPKIELQNPSPTIVLHTAPVLPVWLQLLSLGTGALMLAVAAWWFTHRGHTAPVNAIQINGQGNEVISASDDQTLRRWRIKGNRLVPAGVLERGDKAIRATHYRPVNNDEVVVGFENGMLQINNALSDQTATFDFARDDRVFDLAFSRDARTLFSAHGSGLVLQWAADPSQRRTSQSEPLRTITVDFAVNAIALLGNSDTLLAIAGRYNQFAIADLANENIFRLPYWSGGQTDFILDMATAEAQPNRLATSDSQGFIAVWDMTQCLQSPQSCTPVDKWLGHGNAAVRAVAFSQDGCYLTSVGDDGQTLLWPLTTAGVRQPQALEGRRLHQASQPVNTVDMIQHQTKLHIVSGGDNHQVRLSTARIPSNPQPVGQCVLEGG